MDNYGLPGSVVKNLPGPGEMQKMLWTLLEDPLKNEMVTTPIFLSRKFHGEELWVAEDVLGASKESDDLANSK